MLLPLLSCASRHSLFRFRATPSPSFRLWVTLSAIGLSSLALQNPIALDGPLPKSPDGQQATKDAPHRVDPDTSIAFPTTISIPSTQRYPEHTLLGLGVRTVSFLRVKVYSIGFYADMTNPDLKLTPNMSPDEKLNHVIQNTSCVLRIIPTRSTSYTHLRDAFIRALQGRLALGRKDGSVTDAMEFEVGGPMRVLKAVFPNTTLEKHVPFDLFLAPPNPKKPRSIFFRDMGSIEGDWVTTQLFLHYFEGAGPSPPLKRTVLESLE